MGMSLEGTVVNGMIVLDGAERLPEGARVRVELADQHDFTAACQEAVSFAQRLPAGKLQPPSADMLALAKQAVQQQQQHQDEDVHTWAERLAQDIGKLTD
jgi:hypothetical protein